MRSRSQWIGAGNWLKNGDSVLKHATFSFATRMTLVSFMTYRVSGCHASAGVTRRHEFSDVFDRIR
jgi:hypothetical protein